MFDFSQCGYPRQGLFNNETLLIKMQAPLGQLPGFCARCGAISRHTHPHLAAIYKADELGVKNIQVN
ncbi:hypothetical protein GCM10009860_17060 [Microbacterium mitrae]